MFECKRKMTKLIHEGKYTAEVVIELHYTDDSWSPTMSADDACKLETVQLALKRGDIAEAISTSYGWSRRFSISPRTFQSSL